MSKGNKRNQPERELEAKAKQALRTSIYIQNTLKRNFHSVYDSWSMRNLLSLQYIVPTMPCPAMPCPAIPCPAIPCPAIPCPAIPCPRPLHTCSSHYGNIKLSLLCFLSAIFSYDPCFYGPWNTFPCSLH